MDGVGLNTDDLEAQTINTRTNYYNTEDVSDLADPAVVAIHNLKTVPPAPAPASQQQQLAYSKTANSFAPQIAYTEGKRRLSSSSRYRYLTTK